tara:strand:- start:64 stop:660 length:597 start_codon:yes stop_codon:yes gene_type:complete
MGNELKIVLIAIAVYLVLGIQNLASTSVFLIPYELNPLVILSVSVIILFSGVKQKKSVLFKSIYLVGVLFYSLFSTRTLSLFSNNFEYHIFNVIANNNFTPLISILVFYIAILILIIRIRSKSHLYYALIVIFSLSFIGALANLELLQVICFTVFVLFGILYNKIVLDKRDKFLFSPILYQMFLFIILENTYFILIKY